MLLRTLVAVLLAALAFPAAAAGWAWPVDGRVVTPYRNGDDPYAGGQHRGIDIAAAAGTPVRAAAAGTVTFAGVAGSSGLTVGGADRRRALRHLLPPPRFRRCREGRSRWRRRATRRRRHDRQALGGPAAPALRCPRRRQPARLPRSARAAPSGSDTGERGTAGRSCGRTRAGAGGAAARTRSPRGATAAEGPGGAASAGARRPAVAPRGARETGPRAEVDQAPRLSRAGAGPRAGAAPGSSADCRACSGARGDRCPAARATGRRPWSRPGHGPRLCRTPARRGVPGRASGGDGRPAHDRSGLAPSARCASLTTPGRQ